MTDLDFAKAFVARISRPAKTKTTLELIKIVEQQIAIPVETMFKDEALDSLFRSNNVAADVYKFVRDNQTLFIK